MKDRRASGSKVILMPNMAAGMSDITGLLPKSIITSEEANE